MKFKKFFIAPIKGYQYISRMLPGNCRYYPTCSEYAKWQFTFQRADKAFLLSSLRILRCNQLFSGGIDYPVVSYNPPSLFELYNPIYSNIKPPLKSPNLSNSKVAIQYWIVPKTKNSYFILKDFEYGKDNSKNPS